jgi:hypothetical protein
MQQRLRCAAEELAAVMQLWELQHRPGSSDGSGQQTAGAALPLQRVTSGAAAAAAAAAATALARLSGNAARAVTAVSPQRSNTTAADDMTTTAPTTDTTTGEQDEAAMTSMTTDTTSAGNAAGGSGQVLGRSESAAAGVLSSDMSSVTAKPAAGLLGRLSLSRLSLGLVLDEGRLRELLCGGGGGGGGGDDLPASNDSKQQQQLAGLLGCYGRQLFTATLSPGWSTPAPVVRSVSNASSSPPPPQVAAASAAADATGDNYADGVMGKAATTAMLSVHHNEVTRVSAQLEAASFESAVAPRALAQLAHVALLAAAFKLLGMPPRQLERLNQVTQLKVTPI